METYSILMAFSLLSWAFLCGKAQLTNEEYIQKLENNVGHIGRQLMLQQLYVEEKVRSEGDSGLKVVRLNSIGANSYDAASHSSGRKVASIHNHDNNIRTIGMGELVAVLNGVEFRTRHNDYRLFMPSTTSTDYHETEEVPFPDVPPEVMQHTSVADQVTEMREWFRAFKDQNTTHRDYRPYFKPILCYLEGAWTTSTNTLDESFESDRHFIDAESWHDLQEKIRFTSYTGKKSNDENFAYLPTTIAYLNGSTPILAQWNYRILCHPLQNDLPTNRFRVMDDLTVRVRRKQTMEEYINSRAVRYQLNPTDSNTWGINTPQYQLLDFLMEQIPGKDNYQTQLIDDSMGGTAYPLNGDDTVPLNAGFYNRVYKVLENGAMGLKTRRRGFNDQHLFVAKNTRPEIAPMSARFCKRRNCNDYTERVSYAIPLEIIYMTPLSRWNPYNLKYKGEFKSTEGRTVSANGRNGKSDIDKAFDGINSKVYYQTPAEFYNGNNMGPGDPADTAKGAKWVLDQVGVPREVFTSGTRIITQPIDGVGPIRLRYPIMPLHNDGSGIYKELEALKEIVMNPGEYEHMLHGRKPSVDEEGLTLALRPASAANGRHEHIIELSPAETRILNIGRTVETLTTFESGHRHSVIVQRRMRRDGAYFYKLFRCDGNVRCRDGHAIRLNIMG